MQNKETNCCNYHNHQKYSSEYYYALCHETDPFFYIPVNYLEFKSRSRDLAPDSGQLQLTSSKPNLKRILACLSMRNNAPVEHCIAEALISDAYFVSPAKEKIHFANASHD